MAGQSPHLKRASPQFLLPSASFSVSYLILPLWRLNDAYLQKVEQAHPRCEPHDQHHVEGVYGQPSASKPEPSCAELVFDAPQSCGSVPSRGFIFCAKLKCALNLARQPCRKSRQLFIQRSRDKLIYFRKKKNQQP